MEMTSQWLSHHTLQTKRVEPIDFRRVILVLLNLVTVLCLLLLWHLCHQIAQFHRGFQVPQHQKLHLLLCLIGHGPNVRQQHDPRIVHQTGLNPRLFLVDVETGRPDLLTSQI